MASSPHIVSFPLFAANFVVDTILEMIDKGTIEPDHTVALIYRTNAQSRYLEEACVQNNLPYVIRGGAGGFYKRAEVKDCLCFLRFLHNGNDEGSMLRAVKTPTRGIGDKAVTEFREYCTELEAFYRENFPETKRPTRLDILISMTDGENGSAYSLADGAPEASVFLSKRALNNFLPFSRQMRIIRTKAHKLPVDALLFFIIEELDLATHFDSISKSKAEFEERRENVQELRQATKRYAKFGPALELLNTGQDEFENESALGNFLDDVALVTDITTDSPDGRLVVNLMTIHASKGMEFDAVFVVGNEEGTLPSGRALQEGEGSIALEEEKRLCYVAMTRAKTQLVLTWRKEVTNFASWSDDGPRTAAKDRSRFLDALVSKKSKAGDSTGPKSKQAKARDSDQLLRQRRGSATTAGSQPRRSSPNAPMPSRAYSSTAVSTKTNVDRARGAPSINRGLKPKSPAQNFDRDSPRTDGVSNRKNAVPVRSRPAEPIGQQQFERVKKQPGDISLGKGLSTQSPASHIDSSRVIKSKRPQENVPKNGSKGSDVTFAASKKSEPQENRSFDSTWFFPVGSDVIHGNFGKGVVLQPPPPGKGNDLLVRVEFDNGRTMEFPASGTDIVPDLGL
jgi:ATP-dependent exoDNAse (exonuclease V) beta subunit